MSTETQDMKQLAQTQEQHRWLQKLVGEWTYQATCTMPDGSTDTFGGTETVRSIGDLWIICEGEGSVPGGGRAVMVTTLGFDPRTNRFVGSWIGSMMTSQFVYEGERNAQQNKLTLYSEGPDCEDPSRLIRYADVIEILSDNERTLTGNRVGPDGSLQPMMTCRYVRKR